MSVSSHTKIIIMTWFLDNTIILFHSERWSSAHHIVPLLFPARGIHQGWWSDLVVIHLAPVFLLSFVFVFLWYNSYSPAGTSYTSCTVDQTLWICRPSVVELLLSTTVGCLPTWQLSQMQHNSVHAFVQLMRTWCSDQWSGLMLAQSKYQWCCTVFLYGWTTVIKAAIPMSIKVISA